MQGKSKNAIIIISLIALLLVSIILGVSFGSVNIYYKDVYSIILGKTLSSSTLAAYENSSALDVVWLIRVPRILLATLVGMGLSVSGCVMQAVVKNPLADPYILGVSSGAYLGAVLAIMLGVFESLGPNYVGIGAFVGAFLASLLVLLVSNIGGKSTTTKLILSGTAISAAISAVSNFIVFIVNDSEKLRSITYWMMGSLGGVQWSRLKILGIIMALALFYLIANYRVLDLMLLGDDVAITLGKDLTAYRIKFMLVSSLLVGFIVYSSGMIGFIGLLIPHFARLIVGSGHKTLLIVSALLGAIVLIWSDVLCRVLIANTEIPIGILISLIGSPLFIYMLVTKGFKAGGKNA